MTTAVASGDMSQKVTVDVAGEMLELKNTVYTMVDQLQSFGSEVTRVAREVGVVVDVRRVVGHDPVAGDRHTPAEVTVAHGHQTRQQSVECRGVDFDGS
ncbi:hypothetical protein PWJ43_23715, partial [Streptomyces sp. BE230]|nr:hypothetical protein [Streptomyces sp. BE230]